MANPVVVPCALDGWTKVATAATTGFIWIKDTNASYKFTYRMTTDPAPTDLSDAVVLPVPGYIINASAAIDVYIYAERPSSTSTSAGSVRVDA